MHFKHNFEKVKIWSDFNPPPPKVKIFLLFFEGFSKLPNIFCWQFGSRGSGSGGGCALRRLRTEVVLGWCRAMWGTGRTDNGLYPTTWQSLSADIMTILWGFAIKSSLLCYVSVKVLCNSQAWEFSVQWNYQFPPILSSVQFSLLSYYLNCLWLNCI